MLKFERKREFTFPENKLARFAKFIIYRLAETGKQGIIYINMVEEFNQIEKENDPFLTDIQKRIAEKNEGLVEFYDHEYKNCAMQDKQFLELDEETVGLLVSLPDEKKWGALAALTNMMESTLVKKVILDQSVSKIREKSRSEWEKATSEVSRLIKEFLSKNKEKEELASQSRDEAIKISDWCVKDVMKEADKIIGGSVSHALIGFEIETFKEGMRRVKGGLVNDIYDYKVSLPEPWSPDKGLAYDALSQDVRAAVDNLLEKYNDGDPIPKNLFHAALTAEYQALIPEQHRYSFKIPYSHEMKIVREAMDNPQELLSRYVMFLRSSDESEALGRTKDYIPAIKTE